MKRETIEKILKDVGLEEENVKGALDLIMAEHGKDIQSNKAEITAKENEIETANNTIKELRETVKKFDGKDPEKLQNDLNELQQKYDTDIAAERTKALNVVKETTLKESLTSAGVKDAEYFIFKHGGVDKFAFSDENKPVGITEVITPYKESNPEWFKSDDQQGNNNNDNSTFKFNSGSGHGGSPNADFDKMSDAEYYAALQKDKK